MAPGKDEGGLAARRAALALINGVTLQRKLLAEMLPRAVQHLPAADRARAQRLATETLRGLNRADRVLGPYIKRRPQEIAHNILRLAVWEMCDDGAAPHGAVNAAVSLAQEFPDCARQSGLVNAVLRNIARDKPDWASLAIPTLPRWLRKPLVDDYGKDAVAAMEAVFAADPPLDLTPKSGDPAALADTLGGAVMPNGSVRLIEPGQVSGRPGFAAGAWWVQDAAATYPARALAPQPGMRVLDMCAAPGGKTMQLAAAGAQVTALDISERRMARVSENLARTGLAADLVVADALTWQPGAPFDAILLDAPCSATGTIRRHPDLPHAKDGSDFPALFALQERLIDRALELLRPGGRLVFCTCSLLIDEGEEQLRDALTRHPDLSVDRDAVALPGTQPDWIGPEGGLRLRPDYWAEMGGMDGFFIAVLQKPA